MARPLRDGVDYFPFDVGMLRDPKVKLIKGEFGALGILVLMTVMSSAYEENGYFKEWSDDVCILVADEVGCGCNFGTVAEIVKGCVRRSLFDEGVLNAFGVLTSAGIQRRFLRAASQRDDIQIFHEYWLLDIDNRKDVPASVRNKIAFNSITTSRNRLKTSYNPDETADNTQRKVKDSKGEDSKAKESKADFPPDGGDDTRDDVVPVMTLPLNDKTGYPIYPEQITQWTELYPAVDVAQQLRAMRGWLDANPSRRKTKKGILRFINGWLAKEQDKGRGPANYPQGGVTHGGTNQRSGDSGGNGDWNNFRPSASRGFREAEADGEGS